MAKKKQRELPIREPHEMTYEQAIAELEEINERIEQGEIGLEESLIEYKRGVALAKRCNAILDTVEQELKKITLPPPPTGKHRDDLDSPQR